MPISEYTEPVREESDSFKPIEHVGSTLIVKVREYKTGIVTSNSPEGGPGVIVDLVDLDADGAPKLYSNVLWMGGAMVDGLKAHAGKDDPVMITIQQRKSNTGRKYPAPAALDEVSAKQARKWWAEHEDEAFAVADDDSPPF